MCLTGEEVDDARRIDSKDGGFECWWSNLGNNLPEHLLVEVLCRLPAKSLLRSKLVCQSWCRLINCVCVPKLFVSASISGIVYLVSEPYYQERSPYIEYARYLRKLKFQLIPCFMRSCDYQMKRNYFNSSRKDFLECCNGLFLFSMASRTHYFIFNPATNQVVELPLYSKHKGAGYAALAFHPLESPPPSNYRVVHFNHWHGFPASETVTIDVFSSETGNWLTHPIPLETTVKVASWTTHCVYLNGVMYRLSHSKHLLRFDLNKLSACAFELPGGRKTDVQGFIGMSKGCLHYSNNDGFALFVWVLVEDERKMNCRWVLKHTIHINDFSAEKDSRLIDSRSTRHQTSWFNLYALDPVTGDLYIGFPTSVFRYDIDQKTLEWVYSVYSNQEIISGSALMFSYVPCLAILRDCKQVDRHPWVDRFREMRLNLIKTDGSSH